jgi:hypothetical protein
MPRNTVAVIQSKAFDTKIQAIVQSGRTHLERSTTNCRKHPQEMEHARACSSEIHGRSRKSKPLRVPPGKIVQAQALLVQGHSQREISRTLHMSPMTVAKIIKAEDFQGFIKEMREKLFAFAPDALASFHAQVKVDGHLAYAFMKDLGIIPSREALVTLMNPAPSETVSGEMQQAYMAACALLEGNKNFGIDLPADVAMAMAKESPENTEAAKTSLAKLPRR